jgi:hypothetical protein
MQAVTEAKAALTVLTVLPPREVLVRAVSAARPLDH